MRERERTTAHARELFIILLEVYTLEVQIDNAPECTGLKLSEYMKAMKLPTF